MIDDDEKLSHIRVQDHFSSVTVIFDRRPSFSHLTFIMAAVDTFMFTSESVNEGHPDKLADQVTSFALGSSASWPPCHIFLKYSFLLSIMRKTNAHGHIGLRRCCRRLFRPGS